MPPPIEVLINQLETLLVFLERPIVQLQLLALLIIALLALGLMPLLRRLLRTQDLADQRVSLGPRGRALRVSSVIVALSGPTLGLLLVWLCNRLFEARGWPTGLITGASTLLWVWLGYTFLVIALYGLFGNGIRPYHRRILQPLLLGFVALSILNDLADLRLVARIQLFSFLGAEVSLGMLLAALTLLYAFFVLAWILQDIVENRLPERINADPGVIYSVSTIARYVVLGLGLLIAMQTLGFDLSTLALIGGGLSVGIGIGLQRIVANFISGIMLLFEQSLRRGDVIDLNGEIGTVEQLNMRATLVRTINNVELVVPNETFVTTQVKTFTKTSRKMRLLVPLGVSYDSDPKEVRRIVIETAVRHGKVLNDPAPALLFSGYGNSSLNFDLAVWIDDPIRQPFIRSDLYYMLWDALARNNIEIPFPQRDLNLRRGWEKLSSGAQREPGEDAV